MESTANQQRQVSVVADLFPGESEMARLMRSLDWATTPLGPVENWPQSLRTTVSICLHSRFPILIWWGSDLVMLYNDPYRDIIGAKHPKAMGAPGQSVFPEIWDLIGPMLKGVINEGRATWSRDQLLLLNRNGYVEECYFTFSYSPIYGESGGVDGVFCAVTETSDRVMSERRLGALRELAADASDARSPMEAYRLATRALATNHADLPITLIYATDDTATTAGESSTSPILVGYTGFDDQASAEAFGAKKLLRSACEQALCTGEAELIGGFGGATVQLTLAGERVGCVVDQALILPIKPTGMEQASGALIVGISPLRSLDDAYRSFLDLVVGHIGAALAAAAAYEQERRRAEALMELDRAKTTFFSNVSHEFRTPLTLMLGPLADLLANESSMSSDAREQLELAHRNGLRLLRLVNALLDFSRIEAGRAQATYEPTDLATYTAELASAFRSLIEKAGLQLVVDCPPLDDLPEPVYVDRTMWEKIVLNLLSNAFKFTFAGKIDVLLRRAGDGVELVVRDTGVGVPADEVGRLFERFHRVEGMQARTHEGAGIGLALTQELVQLHGGVIRAESMEGAGTTFVVYLPLGASHLPPKQVRMEQLPGAETANGAGSAFVAEAERWLPTIADSGAIQPAVDDATLHSQAETIVPARILVVDDNADMRDYLRHLLSGRYIVETVANGAEALQAIARQTPDLVALDVMMPELDGFAFLQKLRANPHTAHLPVIILSARAGEESVVEGLQAGADDYLVKPFSARELLSRVAGQLQIAQLRHATEAHARELETLFEAITDAVFVYDRDGRITRLNAAARTLFGLDGLPDFAQRSPEQRAAIISVRDEQGQPVSAEASGLYRLLRGEELTGPNALDVRLRLANGRELEVNIAGAPLRNESGEITGAIAISRDVTERKQLERQTHDVLDALLAMASAIATTTEVTTDGAPPVIQRVVTLAQRVLMGAYTSVVILDPITEKVQPLAVVGLAPEHEANWWVSVSRARPLDYLPPADMANLYAGKETIIVDPSAQPPVPGQDYWGVHTSLVVPAQMENQLLILTVEAQNRPTFSAQERDLARAAARLAALVVEREQLTQQREQAQTQAEVMTEATRRMDEFLGIASHELRTPLTTITANVQIAERQMRSLLVDTSSAGAGRESAIPDTLRPKLERAEMVLTRTSRQVSRLDRLVGDLLDVSRIQSGKLDLRLEPCDLLAIARDCVQEQQTAWPDRTIALELPHRATLPLHADADRIGQVITNLLTNALKYSAEDQPVEVRVTARNGTARVAVRDHGPGLSPEQQAHLWERFYRAPGIEQQSGSGVGLGLGLHICKSLIERHGGQVGVESAPGEGSTFWCTLPLA